MEGRRRAAEARDDDPIIPFGSLPTVSRFGVISRTPKTGYQMAGPGHAVTPSQGTNSPKHTAATGTGRTHTRLLGFLLCLLHFVRV